MQFFGAWGMITIIPTYDLAKSWLVYGEVLEVGASFFL